MKRKNKFELYIVISGIIGDAYLTKSVAEGGTWNKKEKMYIIIEKIKIEVSHNPTKTWNDIKRIDNIKAVEIFWLDIKPKINTTIADDNMEFVCSETIKVG